MRTIAIINQKGGCGKTTTAINLAAVFSEQRHRTLLIDLDPQSHCAAGLAVPEDKIDQDISDALLHGGDEPLDARRFLWRVTRNLDLLPSRTKLAGLEAVRGGLAEVAEPEQRLAKAIAKLGAEQTHDICVIDCPPSIGLLTYNALAAARELIIPVDTSYFSLLGARKQVRTVRSVGRRIGVRHDQRLLATLHNPTSALARDLLDALREQFGDSVIPGSIRVDPHLPEAASFGRPVIEYAPASGAAEDYRSLGEWILGRGETSRTGEAAQDHDGLPEIGVKQVGVRRFAGRGNVAPPAPSPHTALPAQPTRTPMPGVAASVSQASMDSMGTATAQPISRAEEISRRAAQLRAAALAEQQASSPAARYQVAAASGSLRVIREAPKKDEQDAVERSRPSVQRLYGARAAGRRILFVQPIELGQRVCVAGSFNDWDPHRHWMRRNDELGIHELAVDVEPGVHEYRLVVDGVWIDDPYASRTSNNEYGGNNAIVLVMPNAS